MAQGSQISRAYGFNGYVNVFPQPIVTTFAPTNGTDEAVNGQVWIDTTNQDAYIMVDATTSTWINVGGGAGNFNALTVNPGPTALTGALTVTSGTNAVNIAADAAANTVNIATGAGAKTATFGSTNTTSTTTVRSGTGGLNATSTGTLSIASSAAAANCVDINASDAAGSVRIRSAGNIAAAIDMQASAGGINIAATGAAGEDIQIINTGGSLTLRATEADANAIVIQATGGGAAGIQISNDNNPASINIGNGLAAKGVVVGSQDSTSSTLIQSGTGNMSLISTGAITLSPTSQVTVNTRLNIGNTADITFNLGARILSGSADPNGSVTGTDGSLYLRTGTATASTILYVCTGGTTWTAVTVP